MSFTIAVRSQLTIGNSTVKHPAISNAAQRDCEDNPCPVIEQALIQTCTCACSELRNINCELRQLANYIVVETIEAKHS